MSTNDKIAEPRTGTSALVRPRYAPGQMLQDDDLTQAVTYARELNRLLFRSLLGCGVICGLIVSVEEKCGKVVITIAPGVGLDCVGDAVQLAAPQSFVLDPSCMPPLPESMCVVMRHHERSCLPRAASCAQDDEAGNAATRISEGYELRLLSDCPDCGCGCVSKVPATTTVPTGTAAAAATVTPKAGKKATLNAAATAGTGSATVTATVDCACVDPTDPCYADHYLAKCSCCSDCEWLTLARVFHTTLPNATAKTWEVDHSVRRLIRPVLMRDVQAEADLKHILTGS